MRKLFTFGKLLNNPEIRKDQNGNDFITFILVTSNYSKPEIRKDCIEVSCTGELAGVVLKLACKGSNVFVEGYPAAYAFIDSKNEPVAIQRLYARSVDVMPEHLGGITA
jgi:single-stranded DNA-binding protein